jgi:nucleolar protein 14
LTTKVTDYEEAERTRLESSHLSFAALLKVLRLDTADLSSVRKLQPLGSKLLDDKCSAETFSSPQFRCDALSLFVSLLRDFETMYASNDSFPEVFEPFLKPLDTLLALPKLPSVLSELLRGTRTSIAQHIETTLSSRLPLRRNTEKPAQLRQFNPKFEEKSFINANTDPDKERAQMKKLKRKLKDETKGAMRELKKDAQFLQMQKEKKYDRASHPFSFLSYCFSSSTGVERTMRPLRTRSAKWSRGCLVSSRISPWRTGNSQD